MISPRDDGSSSPGGARRQVGNLVAAEARLIELQANLAGRLRGLLNRLSPYDPLEREIASQVAALERSLAEKDVRPLAGEGD